MVLEAASSASVLKMLGWRISGRLERAKTHLVSIVNGDLAAVNGISVALHHIVDGLHKMRQLAANRAFRSCMTTAAVDECLFAPTAAIAQVRSSSLGWEARVRRIVTSSSSVKVGAAVLQKSGFLHCCKRSGRVC